MINLNDTHSGGILWTRDRPVAETSTSQHTALNKRHKYMLPAGFEPAIPASEQLQTYALDGAATGIGRFWGIYMSKRMRD